MQTHLLGADGLTERASTFDRRAQDPRPPGDSWQRPMPTRLIRPLVGLIRKAVLGALLNGVLPP